jgi:hypothetical protein
MTLDTGTMKPTHGKITMNELNLKLFEPEHEYANI